MKSIEFLMFVEVTGLNPNEASQYKSKYIQNTINSIEYMRSLIVFKSKYIHNT